MKRILVVEDSPTQAALLTALLEEHGYTPTTVRSGDAALETVHANDLDLVLSYVVMLCICGYD